MGSWSVNLEPILLTTPEEHHKSQASLQEHRTTTTRRKDNLLWTATNNFSYHKTPTPSSRCKCRIITVKMEVVSISIIHSKHIIQMPRLLILRQATSTVLDKWLWVVITTSIKPSPITQPTVWATRAWTRDQHHQIVRHLFTPAN